MTAIATINKQISLFLSLLITLILSVCNFTYAQSPSLSWVKSMGGNATDEANGIALDASGNIYTIGSFNSNASFGDFSLTASGGQNVFVSKQDAQGVVQWVKHLGKSNNAWGMAIALDGTDNVYVTGYFQGTADFGGISLTATGKDDVFACKLDPAQGDVAWAKSWGGSGDDLDRATSVAVSSSGHIIIAGYFRGSIDFEAGNPDAQFTAKGGSWQDIFVSKFDSDGSFVWAKQMGGDDGDFARAVALDPSDNIYITGQFQRTADFGGKSLTSAGFEDAFVCKMSPQGDVVWVRGMGGGASDAGADIAVDPSGNVYASGYFQETANFNSEGSNSSLTAGNGGEDIYVCKFNNQGELIWAQQAGISSDDLNSYRNNSRSITFDHSGAVYITGFYTGAADFGENNITSTPGHSDIFISKMDSDGNFDWAIGMGSAENDYGTSIAVDASNNIHLTGTFQGTVNFDPGSEKTELTSKGESDIFVLKLSQGPSGITTPGSLDNLVLYPNPAGDEVNLKFTSDQATNAVITIFDITGREVYRIRNKRLYEGTNFIQLKYVFQDLKAGIYLLEINLDNGKHTTRKIEKIR